MQLFEYFTYCEVPGSFVRKGSLSRMFGCRVLSLFAVEVHGEETARPEGVCLFHNSSSKKHAPRPVTYVIVGSWVQTYIRQYKRDPEAATYYIHR